MVPYRILHSDSQCSRRLAHAGIHDVKLHGIGTLRYVISGRFYFNYIKKAVLTQSLDRTIFIN